MVSLHRGFASSSSLLRPRLRIASINDVYDLGNLPRMQTLLRQLQPAADVVCLAGDFLSPSPLSAMDGGKGMVATLRALGVTHVSLGNHEADLRLHKLQRRLSSLQNATFPTPVAPPRVLNSNVGYTNDSGDNNNNNKNHESSSSISDYQWMTQELAPYDIVTTSCGRVHVALLGLLSDEKGMFRDGTFRGAPIRNIMDTFCDMHKKLVVSSSSLPQQQQGPMADWILPLTHGSITRDEALARHMLTIQGGPQIILGGHEHVPFDVRIVANKDTPNNNSNSNDYVRILKSGMDAECVSIVDVYFEVPQEDDINDDENNSKNRQVRVADIEYELIDIKPLKPSMVVQNIVNQHESILVSMENEDVLHADAMLPPGEVLSSKGTRRRQTTLGGILCTCIKEELETDVAILNGAVIKGNTTYERPALTYTQIRQELPFPTKIVVVPMKRWELQAAVEYSRTCPVEESAENNDKPDKPDKPVERRGYLQVDLQFNHFGFHTGDQDEELMVALPRNLLNGFCKIKPLMKVGQRLRDENKFPEADDFIPAMQLVIRHSSKERWYELIHDNYTFSDLDPDAKGFLTRDDVRRIIRSAIQHEPPEFLIDDMMSAIDFDDNGIIDPGEMSHLLAVMEREHGLFRFDD